MFPPLLHLFPAPFPPPVARAREDLLPTSDLSDSRWAPPCIAVYGIHTSHFMTGLTDTGHSKNWACDSQNKFSQDEDHSRIDTEYFSQLPDFIVNYEMCEYRRHRSIEAPAPRTVATSDLRPGVQAARLPVVPEHSHPASAPRRAGPL